MASNVNKIAQKNSPPEESSSIQPRSDSSDLFKDPIKFSFTIGGFLIALALGFVHYSIDPKFQQQSDDIKKLTQEIEDISEKLMAENKASALSDVEIISEIKNLTTAIYGRFDTFNERFVSLKSSVDHGFETVEAKTALTEKRVEEQLATMPETKAVVDQLDLHKNVIDDEQTDAIETLQTLVQLNDDRPARQQILQALAVENSHFSQDPGQLASLWETRNNKTAEKFEMELRDKYDVEEKEAKLLSYDALTEPKPVRFFLEVEEIKASAEPRMASALAEENDGNIPLAEPLTIARVCEKMTKPIIECYNYFLSISDGAGNEFVSFESPSDDAVLKIIVQKHETAIPGK